jgi:hypothetical protein
VALQERNAKLSAVLRLVITLLRVTGLTLARRRVADGAKKRDSSTPSSAPGGRFHCAPRSRPDLAHRHDDGSTP